MAGRAYLAIDLGAESGRAILGVLDRGGLSLREVHRFANGPLPLPTGLHWNLTGLWREVMEGVRRATAWSREEGIDLVSLGVDAWGVDWGLVGRSGELLGLPHCYRDQRFAKAYEQTLNKLGAEAIYGATGIQLMPINTLYQLVAAREAEPKVLDRAQSLLFMPDLIHFFLTGKRVVESSIASTSQMIDPHSGRWATGLLERLGLPTHFLGDIAPSGTEIGKLLPQVAAEVGAAPGLRVIAPPAHDTGSAVAAAPATGDGHWCYISSGTWSLMGAELDRPCLSHKAREAQFTNERGIGGTIRFLKNIIGLWLLQECRKSFEDRGRSHDYAQLTEAAAGAEPFRTLLDVRHEPLMSPGEMPEKIATFARATGQPEPDSAGRFARCCLETLALAYRQTLDQLEDVLDRRFEVIHVVGGGARNALLNQMTADATGRRVVAGPAEATAIGNLLVQAMGSGDIKDRHGIRRVVATSFEPTTYLPQDAGAWDEAYARFLDIQQRHPPEKLRSH